MMYKTVFTGFPRTEFRDNVASSYIIKKEEKRGEKKTS